MQCKGFGLRMIVLAVCLAAFPSHAAAQRQPADVTSKEKRA
jgi:hypothetical protein